MAVAEFRPVGGVSRTKFRPGGGSITLEFRHLYLTSVVFHQNFFKPDYKK